MGRIYVNYGVNLQKMTYELMSKAKISSNLRPNMKVVIKPNLVLASKAENGATTHPEIIEGIITYLQDYGIKNIIIAEGSWVGVRKTAEAFNYCGYNKIAKEMNVALLDTKTDTAIKRFYDGEEYLICSSIINADYLINVPVLKGHCQTKLTCCMKNLKGCIPDSEKRKYHSMGLSRPIASLNAIIKPDLNIVDNVCGDLTFEEGGNPVQTNRILLGYNCAAVDEYCANLIGYKKNEIEYLKHAQKYGLVKETEYIDETIELNPSRRPKRDILASPIAQRLSKRIDENSACSACYAALIFALHNTDYKFDDKIKIGQGFRGKTQPGLGIGNCASGCKEYVRGCPPNALNIINKMDSLNEKNKTSK